MAKLYFRYGTVNSAKTLNLLAVVHNYRAQGKKVLLVKPAVDTRWGLDFVQTRAGLKMPADLVLQDNGVIDSQSLDDVVCVLVDEAQFLTNWIIEQLAYIAHHNPGIPVICYGLRTDFRTKLFPATARLLELADSIEEIKTTCHYCNKKAIFNLKLVNGLASREGPAVELGADEKYQPVCSRCYTAQHHKAAKFKTARDHAIV